MPTVLHDKNAHGRNVSTPATAFRQNAPFGTAVLPRLYWLDLSRSRGAKGSQSGGETVELHAWYDAHLFPILEGPKPE
jgi:hypothetical protein